MSDKYTKKTSGRWRFWKKHQFKCLVFVSILIIGGLYLYNLKNDEEGTWSLEYSYIPQLRKFRHKKESSGETECRRVMEQFFRRPFPSTRPAFLTNQVTGKPLEIDCCNIELRLGVEYNGKQHYEYVPAFHKNVQDFQLQQYRDVIKQKMCKEHGFQLISVPYTIPLHSIENYLIEQLNLLGYHSPLLVNDDYDWSSR